MYIFNCIITCKKRKKVAEGIVKGSFLEVVLLFLIGKPYVTGFHIKALGGEQFNAINKLKYFKYLPFTFKP